MGKYIILPGCDDGNRGDQALVWETKKVAENAGFKGAYSMLCEPENLMHSKDFGIDSIIPILKHPGRKFKNKDNTKYNASLLLKWGSVAVADYICSKLFLWRLTRPAAMMLASPEAKKTMQEFKGCDACFVKGGGFIHSYGSLTDIYQMYFFLYHIKLAQALGKPVYIMPNSYGPFNAPTVKRQVRKALNKCVLVTSRESISQKMLDEIGVKNSLYPDLAFGLSKSIESIGEMKAIKDMAGERKTVAITARPYRFPGCVDAGERYNNYIMTLADTCRWLYQKGYFPVLAEHVLSHHSNERDMCGIEDVAKNLDVGTYYIFSNHKYGCRELKAFYSEMYAVIGTRFHSVIFSLSEKVPCVAITYGGNKGQGIMNDIGLSKYSMAIEDVSFDKMKSVFTQLEEKYDEYVQVLREKVSEIEVNIELLQKKMANKGM